MLTTSLIQALLDGLQLCLEFLVLNGKSTICILEESLEILYPLVTRKKFAFCNASFLLQGGVLIDELEQMY